MDVAKEIIALQHFGPQLGALAKCVPRAFTSRSRCGREADAGCEEGDKCDDSCHGKPFRGPDDMPGVRRLRHRAPDPGFSIYRFFLASLTAIPGIGDVIQRRLCRLSTAFGIKAALRGFAR